MKIAIIDENATDEIRRGLMKRGFYVMSPPPATELLPPLATHPDMLFFTDGKTLVTSGAYVEAASWFFDDLARLTRLNFKITAEEHSREYPGDCIFNALVIGDRLFAKTDTVSPAVLSLARERGMRIFHVNQGYPACTVLPLGSDAAITADPGMARVLSESGVRVTVIENGGISLPPYEYGFIGGAAGVCGDTVYFLGDPATHPSGEAILRAVREAGLRSVSLSDSVLCDLGRIIFAE